MRINTSQILTQLIKDCPDNQLAYKIYDLMEKGDLNEDTDIVSLYDKDWVAGERAKSLEPEKIQRTYKDLRLRHAAFFYFRKFPVSQKGLPFGVDFTTSKGKAANTILVGTNGTGKTSIYSALEYRFTKALGAATLRKYPEIPAYIAYGDKKPESARVCIETNEGILDDQDSGHLLEGVREYLSNFFCSEYDILELGSLEKPLLEYVLEHIGYGDLYKLKRLLQKQERKTADKIRQKSFIENRIVELEERIGKDKRKIASKKALIYEKLRWLGMNKKDKKNYAAQLKNVPRDLLPSDPPAGSADGDVPDEGGTESFVVMQAKVAAYDQLSEYICRILENDRERLGEDSYLWVWEKEKQEELKTILESRDMVYINQIEKKFAAYSSFDFEALERERKELWRAAREWGEAQGGQSVPDMLGIWSEEYTAWRAEEERIKKLEEEKNRLNEEKDSIVRLTAAIEDLREYNEVLKKEYDQTLETLNKLFTPFIKDILNYFSMEEEEFDIVFAGDQLKVVISYRDYCGERILTSPKKHLNSFRYKLYCMTLKLAMAFAVMKTAKINFPIVLDDVFYSSDFYNREKVEMFITRVFEAHAAFLADEESEDKQLQLIFLTHDDLLVDAIRDGLNALQKPVDCIFGRLFDYHEMETSYDRVACHSRLLSGQQAFYNLYINLN